MLRKNLAVEDVTLLPPGRGFLLCEFGAHSEEEVEDIVERFIEDAMTFPEGRSLHATRPPKRDACGRCVSPHWVRASLSQVSAVVGKGGRIPPCRPRSWGPIYGSSSG